MSGAVEKKQIEGFNKLGAYTIPIIAVVAWIVGLSYCSYIGGGWGDIEYGDFATHPTMMLTAFLLVGSIAVCCYKFCTDLGISHNIAKWIHIGLNTLIVLFAWMGWDIIYELHESKHSHYKGSHSRVGIFTIGLWSIYYVAGFYVFFAAPSDQMVKSLEFYRAAGIMCIILAMWTAALGLMWEEYSYDDDRDAYGRSRSGVVVGGLMLIIFLIVGMLSYSRSLLPK